MFLNICGCKYGYYKKTDTKGWFLNLWRLCFCRHLFILDGKMYDDYYIEWILTSTSKRILFHKEVSNG